MRNKGFNRRCSICNKVDSHEIETNVGDYTKDYFVPDPVSDLHFICSSCDDGIAETLSELNIDDDFGDFKL